jgi:hypothetical protein
MPKIKAEVKEEKVLKDFYFPKYNITVKAESMEDALSLIDNK